MSALLGFALWCILLLGPWLIRKMREDGARTSTTNQPSKDRESGPGWEQDEPWVLDLLDDFDGDDDL